MVRSTSQHHVVRMQAFHYLVQGSFCRRVQEAVLLLLLEPHHEWLQLLVQGCCLELFGEDEFTSRIQNRFFKHIQIDPPILPVVSSIRFRLRLTLFVQYKITLLVWVWKLEMQLWIFGIGSGKARFNNRPQQHLLCSSIASEIGPSR